MSPDCTPAISVWSGIETSLNLPGIQIYTHIYSPKPNLGGGVGVWGECFVHFRVCTNGAVIMSGTPTKVELRQPYLQALPLHPCYVVALRCQLADQTLNTSFIYHHAGLVS